MVVFCLRAVPEMVASIRSLTQGGCDDRNYHITPRSSESPNTQTEAQQVEGQVHFSCPVVQEWKGPFQIPDV